MGARTPLERLVQQIEWGVKRMDRDIKVDNIEYEVMAYRAGSTIRVDLNKKEPERRT